MKHTLILLTALFLAPLVALHAADKPAQPTRASDTAGQGARVFHPIFEARIADMAQGKFPETLLYEGAQSLPPSFQGPLLNAFYAFHIEVNRAFFANLNREIRLAALEGAHRDHFTLSGNLGALKPHPRWLEAARQFDYLNMEHEPRITSAEERFLVVKLCEAAETGLFWMPSDTRWLSGQQIPRLYSYIAAQSYALGAWYHVAWCLYDGTMGTRYYGDPETYGCTFDFIRTHRDLFDDYTALFTTALVVPYDAGPNAKDWVHDERVTGAIADFHKRNVPFRLFFLGNGMPPVNRKRLEAFHHVKIIGEIGDFRDEDRQMVAALQAHTVAEPPSPFSVKGAKGSFPVEVLPRVSIGDPAAPMLFHIVQMPDKEDAKALQSFEVGIDLKLLGGKEPGSVSLYLPNLSEPVPAQTRRVGDRLMVRVENFNYWTILSIKAGDQGENPLLSAVDLKPPARPRSTIPMMRLGWGYLKNEANWDRMPEKLRKAVRSGISPLDLYGADYISWGYDPGESASWQGESNSLAKRGIARIGATSPMPISFRRNNGMTVSTFKSFQVDPNTWPAIARYRDGRPMETGGDKGLNRCLLDWSSLAAREYMLGEARGWIADNADGMQMDGADAPVHACWRLGGNFSPSSLDGFRRFLQENYPPQTIRGMGLNPAKLNSKAIQDAIVEAQKSIIPSKVVATDAFPSGKALRIPLINSNLTGPQLRVCTPPLKSPTEAVEIELLLRSPRGAGTDPLGLYLLDGGRVYFAANAYLSRGKVGVYSGGKGVDTGLRYPVDGTSFRLRVRADLVAKTTRVSLGDGEWSEPLRFRTPEVTHPGDFSVMLQTQPNTETWDVGEFTIRPVSQERKR